MKKFILAICLFSINCKLFSQCSELLSHGIYDLNNSNSSQYSAYYIAEWLCQQNFQSSGEMKSSGFNAAIPIGKVLLSFGFSDNEQTWHQDYQSLCKSFQSQSLNTQQINNASQNINPEIIKAFNQCIDITSNGYHIDMELLSDSSFFLYFVYRPDGEGSSSTILEFKPNNCHCDSDPTNKVIGPSRLQVYCERDNNSKEASITINSTANPVTNSKIYLKPIPILDTLTLAEEINRYTTGGAIDLVLYDFRVNCTLEENILENMYKKIFPLGINNLKILYYHDPKKPGYYCRIYISNFANNQDANKIATNTELNNFLNKAIIDANANVQGKVMKVESLDPSYFISPIIPGLGDDQCVWGH